MTQSPRPVFLNLMKIRMPRGMASFLVCALWLACLYFAGLGLYIEGMAMAIEPMLVTGLAGTRLLDDGWTVVTQDGSIAAHFEHTVAITPDGPWVLTAEDGGVSGLAAVAAAAGQEPDHEAPVGARRA